MLKLASNFNHVGDELLCFFSRTPAGDMA